MSIPKAKPATYADLEALPPNVVGEIIGGVLYTHPRPAPRHAKAATRLGYEVVGPFEVGRDGPGGWIFLVEPELHIAGAIVVPDIAGWRRERLSPFPETAGIEIPPDWVCEVLSPSTQGFDRTVKLTSYANSGIGFAWYVDPVAKTLEAFALLNGKWTLAAAYMDQDKVTAPPFEAHTFALGSLWVDEDGPA